MKGGIARERKKERERKQHSIQAVSLAYLDKPQGQVHPSAILDMRRLAEKRGPEQGNCSEVGRERSSNAHRKHRLDRPAVILFTLCCDTTS